MVQGAELVRRGHEVHVVTQSVPDSALPEDEVVHGLQIHRWVKPIRRGPLFGITFVASVLKSLRRLQNQVDLIHTHQALWESISAGLGQGWLINIPTLIQPASSGYYGEAQELLRTRGAPILRRCSLRNTAFAAISAEIAEEWSQLGVPSFQMTRTVSGVDTRRFHPGPTALTEDQLPGRPRVLFTGRLHPQKNLGLLLDAWAIVARQATGHLILLGDGPDREALMKQAEGLGIRDRVCFAGQVSDPSEYLRAADVFVLPSVAEGMSNSLLEAMATGLPCLASEIGGNTDLLREGPCGRLVSENHPEAWASAILQVLNDLEGPNGAGLGAAALRRIETEFAIPVVVDRYECLYQAILEGKTSLDVATD